MTFSDSSIVLTGATQDSAQTGFSPHIYFKRQKDYMVKNTLYQQEENGWWNLCVLINNKRKGHSLDLFILYQQIEQEWVEGAHHTQREGCEQHDLGTLFSHTYFHFFSLVNTEAG